MADYLDLKASLDTVEALDYVCMMNGRSQDSTLQQRLTESRFSRRIMARIRSYYSCSMDADQTRTTRYNED